MQKVPGGAVLALPTLCVYARSMQLTSLVLTFFVTTGSFAQAPELQSPAPTLPYYEWDQCPGEYCVYGQWTASSPTILFNTWKEGRRPTKAIGTGDVVAALTGVVMTVKPGTIRLDRDLPEASLHKGDLIQTYGYTSEGFSAVSVQGKFHKEYDISFAKWPDGTGCGNSHCAATVLDLGEKHWWAQVRLKSGEIGWVNLDRPVFDIRCCTPTNPPKQPRI